MASIFFGADPNHGIVAKEPGIILILVLDFVADQQHFRFPELVPSIVLFLVSPDSVTNSMPQQGIFLIQHHGAFDGLEVRGSNT